MIRVLHVLCDLAGGGAERLVLDLCRLHGPEVAPEVLTVHDGGALEADFSRAEVEVRSAGRRRGGPGLLALARIARVAREFDVIHTHLWAGDLWGRLGGLLAGRPVLRTEHNTAGEPPWKRSLTRALDPASEMVICVSEAAARAARAGGATRVRIIHNGVDLSRFSPRAPHEGAARRVLAMGRLTRQKGLDVLVEAMRGLPGLGLDVLGEGEDAPLLRAPGVMLHGFQADPRPWLARADLLVAPSRWEGFGLVAVEAMACGVPVVASRVDGLVEVVGDAGLLVPPEDPASLRGAIASLAASAERRNELATRGLARAARFHVRETVSAYESVYQGLVNPGMGVYNRQ